VGGEGLELHFLHWAHLDVTDLELSPIVGMWSDIFYISNRFVGDFGLSPSLPSTNMKLPLLLKIFNASIASEVANLDTVATLTYGYTFHYLIFNGIFERKLMLSIR
jgi:hypothetical protein